MKAFCTVLYSKKGYFITGILGMFFSAFCIEMMICRSLRWESGSTSIHFRHSLLYLSFIILLVFVLGYYLWGWLEECRQELQAFLFCGCTLKKLSRFLFVSISALELVSWFIASILFLYISQENVLLFLEAVFVSLAAFSVFGLVISKLFLKYYKFK